MTLPFSVVVSCEHASNDLPDGYELAPDLLERHIAWDPGAPTVARRLADAFGTACHEGKWSRLLVDLNRSVGHPDLMRSDAWGHPVPFNEQLSEEERRHRIATYYRPYRSAIRNEIEQILARDEHCLHVCIHSFTPVLHGRRRRTDLGVLHDPHRQPERSFAKAIRQRLVEKSGWNVFLNLPYRGTADGILPAMKEDYPADRYTGIEFEINQRHTDNKSLLKRIATWIKTALQQEATHLQ